MPPSSCCPQSPTPTSASKTQYSAVAEHYSKAAISATSTASAENIAKEFGYSEDELALIPKDANLGLSCGNPTALAGLREGETVVDLGCGAGFDVFLASKKVGATGKVVGIDMNEDMLSRARKNAESYPTKNISFLNSPITTLPLPSSSADVIISNCVINLVPESDKQTVFNEIHRVLKIGGRVAVSDILAKKELPSNIRNDLALVAGCIGGASEKRVYEEYLREAGFKEEDILIKDTGSDLNIYKELGNTDEGEGKTGCCGPPTSYCAPKQEEGGNVYTKVFDLNEWVGSYQIYAVKRTE